MVLSLLCGFVVLLVTVLRSVLDFCSICQFVLNAEMYYLGDICFVCLAHNENFITYFNIDLMAREIPKTIFTEYIFRKTKSPKLCVGCLNRMFIFRQRCLKNNTFIKYVEQLNPELNKECGINKYVADVSTYMLLLKKCGIYSYKNNRRETDERINKKHKSKMKNGIFYFDNYEHDNELIIKEESCTSKDVMQVIEVEMKSEHLHSIDEHSVNREKHEHYSVLIQMDRSFDAIYLVIAFPQAVRIFRDPIEGLSGVFELVKLSKRYYCSP